MTGFRGFSPEAVAFLKDLDANNERAWFAEHKALYERTVKLPGEALMAELAARLEDLEGAVVTARMFRIHRDIRFSKDKRPYNTHLHLSFAPAGTAGGTGYYFGLEPGRTVFGAGTFGFEGEKLDAYRAAVDDDRDGPALEAILQPLIARGMTLHEPGLRRVPAPYAKEHPRGWLLKHKGLALFHTLAEDAALSPTLIDDALAVFADMRSLNRWIENAVS